MSGETGERQGGAQTSGAAFVAGATGFTGREVVRLLVASGVSTVAHVRPDSDRMAYWQEYFTAMGARVDSSPWLPGEMAGAIRRSRPTHLFALLGTTRARARRAALAGGDQKAESYERVDFGLTKLLIVASMAAGYNPRFVYLSATGVKEGARSPYYRARFKAEEALRASGLPYTIVRPSFISGPGRDDKRPLERVGARVSDGLLTAAGFLGGRKLKERYASLTNTGLARAIVRLALDPEAENRVYEAECLRE